MNITVFYSALHRVALFLFCVGAATTQLAWGAKAKLEEAPVASHYWSETYYDSRKGNTYTTYKTKKTILKPEGIQDVSGIEFIYAQNDKVRVISMIVTQPDGKRIKLKKSEMDTRLLASSNNGFTQDKQLSFLLPELKVGSTIEIIFEYFHSGASDSGKAGIMLPYMPKNERVDSDFSTHTSDQPWLVKQANTQAYDVKLSKDKKQVTIQQKAPRYYYFTNECNNSYLRQGPTVVMHTTDDVKVRFAREMRAWNENLKAPLPQPMREVVDQLKDQSSEEKVIGLLRYLRDNYRYLGDWRAARRGWLPFSLREIAQRGYGDCKDQSMALVAMLRASGIEAEPAIVHRGIFAPSVMLPSVVPSNHAVVRAQVGDKIWWLDPTNPVFLPGYIMPDIHDRWACVFKKDNQVKYDYIPRETSESLEIKSNQVQRYDKEGNAEVKDVRVLNRLFAIRVAGSDYYHGAESTNLQLCENDKKYCQVKREKTDFLVQPDYRMQIKNYKKSAAQIVSSKGSSSTLLVSWAASLPLQGFVTDLQHYVDNQGQYDLSLGNYLTGCVSMSLKDCRLDAPMKPYNIQSPWVDVTLKGYNAKNGKDCEVECCFVRKVDWLDHKTINSEAFKAFLKECEAVLKSLKQIIKVNHSVVLEPQHNTESV